MADADIERFLRERMEGLSVKEAPPDEPLTAWRPVGGYPSDFGRMPVLQDVGPEWDFVPADERWE